MRVYKFSILLIAFLVFSFSSEAIEKERIVKKSYKVNSNTELKIKNSFGKVEVESYDGDEISIVVRIWAKGSSENKVSKFVNSVDIDFDESRDEIEVVTSSISNNGKVKKFVVDYTLRIPEDNYLKIENSFGNVTIDSHKGVVKLEVKHGNIKAGNITNSRNEINLQFGNATINKYGSGEIELQHSNLDINSVLDLKLDSEFSNTEIKEVVRTISAEVSHGSLDVRTFYSKFESIKIEAEFSNIDLKTDGKTSYTLKYKGSFTSFSKPSNLEIINRDKGYTSEEIMGKINGGGSSVNLKLSHSTLSIN
jgi:hypothetical protein